MNEQVHGKQNHEILPCHPPLEPDVHARAHTHRSFIIPK